MKKYFAGLLFGILTAVLFFIMLIPPSLAASSSCAIYDPVEKMVKVTCSEHFTKIATEIHDSSKIANQGNGVWLLKTTILSSENTTLSIDPNDNVTSLRIAGDNGIIIKGRAEIDGIKITSWNVATKAPVKQNSHGSFHRGYIEFSGTEGGWIKNSDISDLGYQGTGKTGFSFDNQSHDFLLYHNKFHSLWYGTYSNGAYNMIMDGNEYYENLFYSVDPHTGSHDFKIINNNVHNNFKIGIICSLLCYNILVENNTVHDDGGGKSGNGYGIFFSRESYNSIARHNTVYNESIGIIVSQSSNNEVYGNKISDTNTGIVFRNAQEGNASNNFIHDNEIKNSVYGIFSNETNNNRVSNTTFSGLAPSFYYYLKDGATLQIEKQIFNNTTIYGFNGNNSLKIVNSAKVQVVEGNTSTNVAKPIFDTGSGPVIFHLTNNNLTLNTVVGSTNSEPPTLTITSPGNNTVSPLPVVVFGIASENTTVTWKVDTRPVSNANGTTTTSWSIKINSLTAGNHAIQVNATDPANNIVSKTIIITIPEPTTITGLVFDVIPGAGQGNNGVLGIPGARVIAVDLASPGTVLETTTDANGTYLFDNVTVGHTFLVQVAPVPKLHLPLTGFHSYNYTTISSTVRNRVDFAFSPITGTNPATIIGTVFEDANNNGVQDPGEKGLNNTQVFVEDFLTLTQRTVHTDINGHYNATGVLPDNVLVQVSPVPSGFLPSTGHHSFAYPSTLGMGSTTTLDFPLRPVSPSELMTIHVKVFNDTNGNGIQDNGETGLSGVQVFSFVLLTAEQQNKLTNGTGDVTFNGITPDVTLVQEVTPQGLAPTSPVGTLGFRYFDFPAVAPGANLTEGFGLH